MQRPMDSMTVRHLKGGAVSVSQSLRGTGPTESLHMTLGVVEGTGVRNLHPFVQRTPGIIEGLGGEQRAEPEAAG